MSDIRVYQGATLQAIITEVVDITEKQILNGGRTLQFNCTEQLLKTSYLTTGKQLLIDGQTYDVNYIEVTHDYTGAIRYRVEAEHVSYRLIAEKHDYYTDNDTPAGILTTLLAGTDFSIGTFDYASTVLLAVPESTNSMQLLITLANQLGGKLVFTGNGYTVNILNQIDQNNGAQIRIRKNLKGISKIVDTRSGVLTASYKVDFVDLERSNTYQDIGLVNFDAVDVGDSVRIIDEILAIDITARVVTTTLNPLLKRSVTVEITNVIDNITTWTARMNAMTIKQGQSIYGTKIDKTSGITVERNDKKARSIFNADTFTMQNGNGLGAYTDAIYFDAVNNKYKFVGDIIMQGGSISWADVATPTYDELSGGNPPLTYIDANGIYTGTLTANQINVINGIVLGTNATIQWASLTDPLVYSDVGGTKPPADADNTISVIGANRLTYIGPTGIYTGTLTAEQVNAVAIDAGSITTGTLSANFISGGTISGVTIDVTTDATIGSNLYVGGIDGIRFENDADTSLYTWVAGVRSERYFANAHWVNGDIGVLSGRKIGAFSTLTGAPTSISGITFTSSLVNVDINAEFDGDVAFNEFKTVDFNDCAILGLFANGVQDAAFGNTDLRLYSDSSHYYYINKNLANAKQFICREDIQLAFFSGGKVNKQSVTDPSAIVTTQTADLTYDSTERDMLNNLKTDVTNIRNKLGNLIDALQAYNLV